MNKKPSSYARFFVLIAGIPGDTKEIRETFVERFTGGRTTSLKEMTSEEYDTMCRTIEAELQHPGVTEEEYRQELRSLRSATLRRMQKLGVDTSDWTAVDSFCFNKRIAGKRFSALSVVELRKLIPKLEAMLRKPQPVKTHIVQIPIFINPNQIPS